MKKYYRRAVKESSLAMLGFTLMQIGTVLMLVAQSFYAAPRFILFGCGLFVLLMGGVLCMRKLTFKGHVTPHESFRSR